MRTKHTGGTIASEMGLQRPHQFTCSVPASIYGSHQIQACTGLVQNHTYFTNVPPPELGVGTRESRTLVREEFPEAGEPLLEQTYGQYGNHAYSLTFYADLDASGQVNHHLKFVLDNGSGKALYSYGVDFPLTPESPLWGYRHLFGQEPLIVATHASGRTP